MKQASYSRDFQSEAGTSEDRDTCLPRFYLEAEEYTIDGERNWRDVEMVEVIMPGNSLSKPVHYVTEIDRKRWPRAYGAFKDGQELPVTGAPLEQWPRMTKSMVLKLKSLGFRTVEDVARMHQQALSEIGAGSMGLKMSAQAYVDDAQKMAITEQAIANAARLELVNSDLQAQNKLLNEQMALVTARIQHIEQQQQFALQNTSSTPMPMMQPTAPIPARPSTFASFGDPETRRSERTSELAAYTGPVEPLQPDAVNIDMQIPAKRKGRPTNAEIAARKAAQGG